MDKQNDLLQPSLSRQREINPARRCQFMPRGSIRTEAMREAIENNSYLKRMRHKVKNIQETNLIEIFKDDTFLTKKKKLKREETKTKFFPQKIRLEGIPTQASDSLKRQLSRIFTKQNTWVEQNKKSVASNPLTSRPQNVSRERSPFSLMKTETHPHNFSTTGYSLQRQISVDNEVRKVLKNCFKNQPQQNHEREFSPCSSIADFDHNSSSNLPKKNSRVYKKTALRCVNENGLGKFKAAMRLTSYEFLNFYTFHRALLKDCLVQNDSHKDNHNKVDIYRFKKGISVFLKVPIQTVERAIGLLSENSQYKGQIFNLTQLRTFFQVMNKVRDTADVVYD